MIPQYNDFWKELDHWFYHADEHPDYCYEVDVGFEKQFEERARWLWEQGMDWKWEPRWASSRPYISIFVRFKSANEAMLCKLTWSGL
jgi:hypothetical protein